MNRSCLVWALLVVGPLVFGACGPTIVMNPDGHEILPQRLAAIPSTNVQYEFDFNGERTIKEDWIRAAQASVDASISYRVSTSGVRYFSSPGLSALDGYDAFRDWSALVLLDVINASLGRLQDPPASVAKWHFPDDLRSWQAPLAADHVLITLFVDGHDTAGRGLGVALVGGWTSGHRAAACVVRLKDGGLVRCQVNPNMMGDIRKREGAQRVVDGLLGSMLHDAALNARAPRAAPVVVPPSPKPPPPVENAPAAPQHQDDE